MTSLITSAWEAIGDMDVIEVDMTRTELSRQFTSLSNINKQYLCGKQYETFLNIYDRP